MRESINGVWVLALMMVFISIFIAFVCIQINYGNAFQLKTEIVTVIEEYEGLNSTTLEKIDTLIKKYGYVQEGTCRYFEGKVAKGITNQHAETIEGANLEKKYQYCVYLEKRNKSSSSYGSLDKYYYTVQVFFGFDLPVLGNLFNFRVVGETHEIMYPNETIFDPSQIYVTN